MTPNEKLEDLAYLRDKRVIASKLNGCAKVITESSDFKSGFDEFGRGSHFVTP